ncbi:MAG: glycoside hydrolase family 3 protein [Rhodothermales bacterium]
MTKPHSLRDRIAQLIFPRIGSNMPPAVTVAEDAERIGELLDRHALGGLCLFNGDRFMTPQALAVLQSRSRFPLLVATDMERGVGQQLRGATVFPHALAYASLSPDDVEEMARISAREALAAGIHISFSPVADVASNPRNPIIATRAYGTDPETASARVAAYICGCAAEGLLSTAKHFPGHGDTETDSHDGKPVLTRDRESLDALELPPFAAAIQAGVPLVMTAHVAYPALDASGRIATASKPILQDLLRDEMGFRGAVISDSLLMAGATAGAATEGEEVARILKAGVDILLDVRSVDDVIEHLVTAAHSDAELRARVDEAFERLWTLKTGFSDRFGDSFFLDPGTAFEPRVVGCAEHQTAAAGMAARALVEYGESYRFFALKPGQKDVLCVLVRPHVTYNDPAAGTLEKAFLQAFPNGTYREILPETDEADLKQLVDAAAEHRGVVVAVIVKPAAWHKFGLQPAQHRFVREMCDRHATVLASLGSPTILSDFPGAVTSVCLFSDVAPSQQALASWLSRLQ